ncbi:FixH family protein [Geobacillus stearothermophilus]|uniref:FixH family protein n=1 Tax=Geobacillus stearothermophilus TaxID=1422 RepID=UPI002E24E0B3|nr:FixH family protein [Geobacillus stearothermophilus]MED3730534.1 FixH family protein [Geobacillus stearothermophilus]MED3747668.1 FixH family protein [Geobacillus stearothermophilus]MED3750440.1 FixH family protein [Geobacillus stearothermophilus]MED3752922.1 FixH family protein [Geobacillus stearothermophilus]
MRRQVGFAFAVVLLGMMIMVACTNHYKKAETPAVLDVKIDAPDHIDLNKPTKLACVVTYGGEKVDDASEVKFEVWKHGSSEREMLEAKHDGDGRYSVEKTFTQAGTYSVVAHVTARDMHNMPKKDIVAGNPEQAATADGASENSQGSAEEHHHGTVAISLSSRSFEAGKPAALTVRLSKDGRPLTGATVRFEIWQADNKHEFVDAKEKGNGEYEAMAMFANKGTYSVKVHVEGSGGLHEHQVEHVTVH